jgi:hypothetical protein
MAGAIGAAEDSNSESILGYNPLTQRSSFTWGSEPRFPRTICRLQEEIRVAKRRNLKKEKAERNRAYARQFRASSSRTTSRGRGRFSNDQRKSSENEGAADT